MAIGGLVSSWRSGHRGVAMVGNRVWVFAGGGEAELAGLIVFLEKNFSLQIFERKAPIRKKPGPRPGYAALGQTGRNLSRQIRHLLQRALQYACCEVILVIDDLDCQNMEERYNAFLQVIYECLANFNDVDPDILIVFAAPELESWLVADWSRTFAFHPDLRAKQVEIRRELSKRYQSSCPNQSSNIQIPESFSWLNLEKNTCDQKLSKVIIETVWDIVGITYSKDHHSGSMLANVNAQVIIDNCPSAQPLRRLYG